MNKFNIKRVFLLHHVRVEDEDEDEDEDVKLIGVFSSKEKAEEAKNRVLKQPGFKSYPDGFSIDGYIVDKESWTEGFGFSR